MTSPAILANASKIYLNSTDFSGDISQVAVNFNQGEIDTSTFGASSWKEFIVSITDGTFDLTAFYNKLAAGLQQQIFSMLGAPINPISFEIDFPSSAVGSQRYTGNCYCKSEKLDGKVNDAARLTASLRITGACVKATIAS